MTEKLILGYWSLRGLGQVSRLLLTYTGANWEEVRYTQEQREKWFEKDKKELGLAFPNFPYLIDGDFKLTESKAVNHYIIKRSGKTELLGKDLKDESLVECVVSVIQDLKVLLFPMFWDKDFAEKLPGVI
jgi:glutathione S-transferase